MVAWVWDYITALTPLGQALEEFQRTGSAGPLMVLDDLGGVQELPVEIFFRSRQDLRPCDRVAIEFCCGRILDVGAGAGAITLILRELGFEVQAIDPLPQAVLVMRARGLSGSSQADVREYRPDRPFDTILLLMNGAGLAGTVKGLPDLLEAIRTHLTPSGQVLIDSTDPSAFGAPEIREDGRYGGELHYQLEYAGHRGPPFPYLFVDPDTFRELATRERWRFEVIYGGKGGEYLARLTPRQGSPEARDTSLSSATAR
jgi:SAM-dependent methyltransferase